MLHVAGGMGQELLTRQGQELLTRQGQELLTRQGQELLTRKDVNCRYVKSGLKALNTPVVFLFVWFHLYYRFVDVC